MSTHSNIRVRFAPAPTGMMHLGNVRTALLNYLFARQKGGTLVIRVEDTDQQRNYDPGAKQILADLQWLMLDYQEGPGKGGPYAPYFQSERDSIYQEQLEILKLKQLAYRCFCTPEELEIRRQRQLALKLPPRYDRTCAKLTDTDIQRHLDENTPFIWRCIIDSNSIVTINDLARGIITFDMKNFSDFPLTRADGKVTFLFANFVDDMLMKMTHVIRGEDHLTNTAYQAALYAIYKVEQPIFWHLPIIANEDGKKLSKRDFGFSLNDLREAGYLPEAINNYLAIIGGGTFKEEIMSLDELASMINFDGVKSTGHVRYDVEKLRWVNHKWLNRISMQEFTQRAMPFLLQAYPDIKNMNQEKLAALLTLIKPDAYTLADTAHAIAFMFHAPEVTKADVASCIPVDILPTLASIITNHSADLADSKAFVTRIKEDCTKQNIKLNFLFWFVRLALIGKQHGPALHDLIDMLGAAEAKKRIDHLLKTVE